jgi:homoserine O-acetyltransferase
MKFESNKNSFFSSVHRPFNRIKATTGLATLGSSVNPKNKIASLIIAVVVALGASCAHAADTNFPPPVAGDFVIHDFHFRSGQTLSELRMHYLTFGSPRRDASGKVRNAVLILHGTTGSSAQFLRSEFANEL